MKKSILILLMLIICTSLFLTACDQMGQVKGVKERGEIEEEPEIIVKDETGNEQKYKLEEYITGVVAGEMPADWPENAYGAQAILARTFALKYMEENDTKVISDSFREAQQYDPEKITKEIEEAVKKTRGEVVLYNEQYIKGWFHSSAGGFTTTAKVGLAYEEEEPPYVKSVKSPDEKAPEDVKEWKVRFNNEELQSALTKMGKDIGQLKKIEIKNKDNTGRAIEFVFSGSNRNATVKAANFRKELDPQKLKSIKIEDIKKVDNGYEIKGSGYGHGVGLSQWGAYSLALDKKNAEEIIDHYYKNIEIIKLYE